MGYKRKWAGFALYMTMITGVMIAGLFIDKSQRAEAQPFGVDAMVQREARTIGSATCTACHSLEGDNWAHTIHGAKIEGSMNTIAECESCHGPGSEHKVNPGDPTTIIRFSFTSAQPINIQNSQCLSCHSGGERLHWLASVHESADVACSDCHNPMATISGTGLGSDGLNGNGLLSQATINETCFLCHKEQRIDFKRRSHMPLFEGKIGCTDCHNPHGSDADSLLHTPTVNETCTTCHAEKRGPFLFEHAPVTDNCLTCHNPHGSNHESLLNTPRPLLCQQCHSMIGHMNDLITRGFLPAGSSPDPRGVGRSCQNCHVQVHGSNHPSGAQLLR